MKTNKETGELEIEKISESLCDRVLNSDSLEEEIESVSGQLIDEDFIRQYCSTYCFDSSDRTKAARALGEYIGRKMSIYEALNDKNV